MLVKAKVYARYYVEDCDVCSDGEINREGDDFAECGECQCNMCLDCAESMRCVVCDEEDFCSEEPAMCDGCKVYCKACDIYMHRKCMVDHIPNCNRKARAERTVASADDTIDDNIRQIVGTKRRLAALEEEIRAAKHVKAAATLVLQSLA